MIGLKSCLHNSVDSFVPFSLQALHVLMPPRPFPFQFGIGIDVVQTSRLRDLITKETRKDSSANPTSLYKFLRWSLTYKEQDAFWARFGGLKKLYRDEVALGNCAHYLAGRYRVGHA